MHDLVEQNRFSEGAHPDLGPERGLETPARISGALEVNDFLRSFCAALLAVGSQTARVDRNAARIAKAFGFEVDLAVFPKHLMISVSSQDGQDRRTSVGSIKSGAPDFQKVAELNALGWRIVDKGLNLEQAWECFKAIRAGRALIRQSCGSWWPAPAAFCRLFGGDVAAMALVFAATLAGFFLRQLLARWGVDAKIIFFLCAFAASLLASPGVISTGARPRKLRWPPACFF